VHPRNFGSVGTGLLFLFSPQLLFMTKRQAGNFSTALAALDPPEKQKIQ